MVREEAEKRLALLEEQVAMNSKKGLMSSVGDLFCGNKRQRELQQIEAQVRIEYKNSQISMKREEIVDRHTKSRHVMKKWIGVSTQEVFHVGRSALTGQKRTCGRNRGGC